MNNKEEIENFLNFLNNKTKLYIFESKIRLTAIKMNKRIISFKLMLEKESFNKILISNLKFNKSNIDISLKDLEKWKIDLKKYLSIKEFIPKTSKEYALVHNTHSSMEDNEKETNFFLRRKINKEFSEENIEVVLAKKDFIYKEDNVEYLFIVENYKIFELNNFFKYFKSFKLDKNFIEYNIENIKIMYGGGSKINSFRLNNNYFKHYKKVFYFGDYDDEGYKIFNTFQEENINSEFIMPLKEKIEEIQLLMSRDDIVKYRNLKNTSNKDYLIKSKKLRKLLEHNLDINIYEMQQEVFL